MTAASDQLTTTARDLFGHVRTGGDPVRQLPLPLGWRDRAVATPPLLIGNANRAALAALTAPSGLTDRVLVLAGPPKSGRSRLAAYAAPVGGDCEIIDDADRADEETLFHAINRALTGPRRLLLIIAGRVADWPISLADLRTRIIAAPELVIATPDAAMLAAVLRLRLSEASVAINDDVTDYAVSRISRCFEMVDALASRLIDDARTNGERLSIGRVRSVMLANGWLQAEAGDHAAA